MSPIRIGAATPAKIYAGATEITKIYAGTDLVYTSAAPPPPPSLLTAAQVYAFVNAAAQTYYACHFVTAAGSLPVIFTRRTQDTAIGTFIADNPSPPTASSPDLGRVRLSSTQLRVNKHVSSINFGDTYTSLTIALFKPVTGEFIQFHASTARYGSGGGFLNMTPQNVNSASDWEGWKLADSEGTITAGTSVPDDADVSRFLSSLLADGVHVIYATYADTGTPLDPYGDFA